MFPTTTLHPSVLKVIFFRGEKHLQESSGKVPGNFRANGVKSSSSIEVGNDVAGNIMEVVEREHIHMTVISTHGISAMAGI